VFVGGQFAYAGTTANNIVRWDGSSFSALTFGSITGTSGAVNALIVAGSDLYLGGAFNTAGSATVNNVARWDGSAFWPLTSEAIVGVSGTVSAFASTALDRLYIAGNLLSAGTTIVHGVAEWNMVTFASLPMEPVVGVDPFYGTVFAFAVDGSSLYVGGDFTASASDTTKGIARWDNSSFWPLSTGADVGVSDFVRAMAVMGTNLYLGGDFTSAGSVLVNNIARWDGSAFWPLSNGVTVGINGIVFALAVKGTDLFIAGEFLSVGSTVVNHIVRWDGSIFYELQMDSIAGVSSSGYVHTLAVMGTDLYLGGEFATAGSVTVNSIARWTGSQFVALQMGPKKGVSGTVCAIHAVPGSSIVYVGGNFTSAGSVTANSITRWDGSSFQSFESQSVIGVNGSVCALAIVAETEHLYLGGDFILAGPTIVNNIARWNGSVFTPLQVGSDIGVSGGGVLALAVLGSHLYIGGWFTRAGGVTVNEITRWDISQTETSCAPSTSIVPPFREMALAPYGLSCGLTSDGELYCWYVIPRIPSHPYYHSM
jgi:hypothetical protein